MTDSKITEIQDILTEVDAILRKRLAAIGLNIPHLMLAIAPDGAGVVRSNVGPPGLADLAEFLAEIVVEAASRKSDNEPLN